ncbi:3-hydroxyisobutyryl-CoA hydrolase [Brevibacillus agri]|uniref:3-hydroxyisobutyryl-CoA hydrolase n=1 Tax=Brevibacillus agri TaxID=51101 RepID=A0A3M8BDV7_9BACL|nr:enoyl-CoA hydratase/isomerase family protein [Brevibacillus agri]MED1642634.1 enoyl-CoA hydratase/isomerase family protein [Brevibacillus agri]MED1653192.1 enoyl-CoA hydratase/isomerase family protein [Brevibacillus agri]MED1686877.1 enoyl-CoA hydratase/isomerase family protein [Brevibacillus agri]MED1692132.1 enoyl-CoA hydratase/isomerase family protein [Brevibacillus agri]MED1698344.1 enoyl-CoA hydratase/isomerase family protein [Brevibacillus agri]
MTNDVLFSVGDNGLATITLNRPQAINSLTHDMVLAIGQRLREWAGNENVRLVLMKGEGTKGFCAGGDIKALYEANTSAEAMEQAVRFFADEYQVDQMVYAFAKPIVAVLDGVVMGGGVGLTYGASHKIVTERTKWSMPEMNIGFFPDVGAAYFLNQAPGHVGRYLALTAAVIQAPDVLYSQAANVYMTSERLEAFCRELEQKNWSGEKTAAELDQLIQAYAETPAAEGKLAALREQIDRHFAFATMEEILASLETEASEFAEETKQALLSKSPSSLKVTLKQLVDGKSKTREECFATDLVLAQNFMRHPDFFEGVRSVLIDKDRSPRYAYRTLEDVSQEVVQAFFVQATG